MNTINRATNTYNEVEDTPRTDEIKFIRPDYASFQSQEAVLDQIINSIERQAARATLAQMAGTLKNLLSAQLTSYMVGVASNKSVQRWASGAIKETGLEEFTRLLTAYEIVQLITYFETENVARAWFLGLKAQLDYMTPAEAIRQKKLREVKSLAKAFVAGVAGA
jgi:hypothetical protein